MQNFLDKKKENFQKMYKYKVGDKVRVIEGTSWFSFKLAGKIGTIISINESRFLNNISKNNLYVHLDIENQLDINRSEEGGVWINEIEPIDYKDTRKIKQILEEKYEEMYKNVQR